jgi:hypothetical protein
MKTQPPASVACCTALLMMTVPLMARAANNTLVLTDAEPQYANKLCWAAADVLAVNQFYPNCPPSPSTPPASPALFPTSQALNAAWHMSVKLAGASLSWYLSNRCEPQIGNCNYFDFPPLYGLTFNKGFTGTSPTTGTNSGGLMWKAVKQEIDAGRPFLFIWDYPEDETGLRPVDKHQLVATGYSDELDSRGTQYLQIWDPWPVPLVLPSSVPACGPAPDVVVTPEHSRWVYFSTYTSPGNDMGVTVAPLHEEDRWNLAVGVAPDSSTPSTPSAPILSIDGGTPPPSPPPTPSPPRASAQVSFAQALGGALPEARQLDLRVFGVAAPTLGVPFPIVGLGLKKLLSASHNPTALLTGRTSVILFPVESQGKVVDAFLMLLMDGRWQRGGYANLEITQRLVAFRARYAAQKHLPVESFYMVSVPGEVTFFAAHGTGKNAIFIPASTDPTIKAVASKAAPAAQLLKALIREARDDLQRYADRGPDTVRPRPQ